MRTVLVRQPRRHHQLVRVSPAPWPPVASLRSPWMERIGRLTVAVALAISVLATALVMELR